MRRKYITIDDLIKAFEKSKCREHTFDGWEVYRCCNGVTFHIPKYKEE